MTKHTPWRVKNAGKKGGVKVIDRNGVEVAETMCATDEDYEHARLIAAAPELLAALERFSTYEPGTCVISAEMLEQARSALSRS